MARIISGQAGSIPLKRPASVTRPTTDRVRESVFAKLETLDAIAGRNVLDLFAGTGALALEALSRGAAAATLVEQNRAAASVIEDNVQLFGKAMTVATGAAPQLRVVIREAGRFLLAEPPGRYDLVFIDPPYEFTDQRLTQLLAAVTEKMQHPGVVVVERNRNSNFTAPEALKELSRRDYGDTKVYIFESLSARV